MTINEMIEMQESFWPVICPYCHKTMKCERVVVSPSAYYQYFCNCGACSPEGSTKQEAYDIAFAYNHQLVEAKNIEYQKGFEDGYKSGRSRGHGFSY